MKQLLAALTALHLVAAQAQSAPISISPLTITPPVGDDWQIVGRTEAKVVFRDVKAGDENDTIAYVSTASFDPRRSLADFPKEVKVGVQKYLRGPNAQVLNTAFEPTKERSYPCVRVRADVQSTGAEQQRKVPAIRTMRLLLCRAPGAEAQGFVVGFTFTPAPESNKVQEAAADAFFRGVLMAKE